MTRLRFDLLKTVVANLKIGFSNWVSSDFQDLVNNSYSATLAMGGYFRSDIFPMLNHL